LKNPSEFTVAVGGADVDAAGAVTSALAYLAERPAGATLILGHGAGAGQRSTFMVDFSRSLSSLGIDVVTFNFLYTEQQRRIPDRGPALEACYRAVIETARAQVESARRFLFIGGKSMGGRIATQVAGIDHESPLAGLVLLGYPLHPPGKPEQLRDRHLPHVQRPMLFVQGRRDAFGTPAELSPILERVTPRPALHVVDGDHSFKLSKKDPAAQAALYVEIQQVIAEWIDGIRASAP
jgi:predicted alpha/beta-hydrolase family hydrolase